jgi:thiol-disulfide isomerase/thioredoxin
VAIFASAAFCEPLPSPYLIHADQMALYTRAVDKAATENKAVVVVFGTEWCGFCRSLGAVMDQPDFKAALDHDFVIVHIALETRTREKISSAPAVFELVNRLAKDPIDKIPGYPWLAMVNPSINKSIWIDSTPFEGSSPVDSRIQHDGKKLVLGLQDLKETLKE